MALLNLLISYWTNRNISFFILNMILQPDNWVSVRQQLSFSNVYGNKNEIFEIKLSAQENMVAAYTTRANHD